MEENQKDIYFLVVEDTKGYGSKKIEEVLSSIEGVKVRLQALYMHSNVQGGFYLYADNKKYARKKVDYRISVNENKEKGE